MKIRLGAIDQLVHLAQAVGKNFHDMRGKKRILLNQELEPALVQFYQAGSFARSHRGAAR